MKKNQSTQQLLVAAAIAASFSPAAFAQNQAAELPASEGVYTLTAPASASKISATAYELTGTSISGSAVPSATMLTAPTGNAAPFKTESGIYLYPTVFLGVGHNDNLQTSSTNQISSSLVNFAPQLVAELKNKGDRFTALASLNNVNYASSSSDNTTNYEVQLAGDHYFTARARGAWSVGQVRSTDVRGANNRAVSAEPDRWTSNNVDGRFVYGAAEAQGRIEVDLGNQDKTYTNNRANTAVADVSVGSFASRLFYRLGSRSLALVEYRNAKAKYASNLSTDSNTEQRYYAGLTWDATAATTGIVKIGRMTKDFTAPREGYSGASWEAAVRWSPRTYSVFELQTSRSTADSSGFGTYALNTGTNLTWNHKWNQSFTTRAALGLLNTDFGGTTRSDTTTTYALTADYALRRWLTVGVDFARTDNSSNVATSEYKRNVTMLTLNASL